LTTFPLESAVPSDDRDHLIDEYLSDVLMFASGYPNTGSDHPWSSFDSLSTEVQRKIYALNAEQFLRQRSLT
jgi:predicted TIM-barrel fold metal-dependent hydrolase